MTAQLDVEALVGRDVALAISAMGWEDDRMIAGARDCANGISEKPYPHNRLTSSQISAFRDVLRGVRAALAGEDARVAAAVAGERERQGVVDDALKSLPVLITMLKTAGLVKGADVAEQMYQRAAAIRETPSA